MKKAGLLLGILFFSIFLLIVLADRQGILSDKSGNNSRKISVVLAGFGAKDADGEWSGEAAPLLKKLDNPRNVIDKVSTCQSAYEGSIFGNKVLVAASGMAKVKTTACVTDILRHYGGRVKEVIFVGIAGITPAGGKSSEPAMIGDVCINFLAFDFDLQHYSSDQANSKLPNPVFWAQKSSFSAQYIKGDADLAAELYQASSQVRWADTPASVKEINDLYHPVSRGPKAWGLKECMEATSDLYWHDIRADRRARETAAEYFNQIYGSSLGPEDVLVATAMEAVPTGAVIEWWNESNGTDVAFAYVRGASNFDHPYLNRSNTPAVSGRKSIEKLSASGGAGYAIETAAQTVLKMFELRKALNK